MRAFKKVQLAMLVIAISVVACSSKSQRPEQDKPQITEQSLSRRQPESPTRVVVHGDTLYSIAWETGNDYRELAAWNQIRPPYTIRPGQSLRVQPPDAGTTTPATDSAKPAPEPKKPAAKLVTGKTVPPAPKTGVPTAQKKSITNNARAATVSKPHHSLPTDKPSTGSWVWPANGPILKRFSDNDSSKGLDIGGTRGQPVYATESGRVVYQGSGLRGYGQLIIIKHSDEFLSAYAHNDRIYVKEGDLVKRGQKIASMGSTGTDRVKLHFEIRRRGAPADPLRYLSKR